MKIIVASLASLSVCLSQAPAPQSPLVREGAHWTRTTAGTVPCAVRGQLKVVTGAGNVALRGVSRDDCGFKVRQRTRAASETEARYRIGAIGLRTRSVVETSIISVQPAVAGTGTFTEIEVFAPRSMREATVNTKSGDINVIDMEGAVDVETGAGALDMDRIGGNVTARTAGGPVRIGRVGGTLHCYSGGGLIRVNYAGGETWCDTAGGEVSIVEVLGPLHVTTGGGNIDVDKAASSVSARSLSGIIDIQEAGGLVTAVARGGSIQIGSAKGGAKCEASGGTIRVKTQDGPLRLSTSMGNILAQLLLSRTFEDSFVNSDSGDVTVLIPSAFSVSVLAMNETPGYAGRILSDFPEIRVIGAGGMRPVKAEGTLNGGGPLLQVSTASGNIFLRRQR